MSAVLEDRGELEAWVEGRDPATGEVKGVIRPGGPERAPLRFVEVVVNNPKSLSVVATQDPVVAAALERVMARQADEICKYFSAVAVTRTGRRGAQVELGGLEVETARVTHLTSREGDPHRHVHLMLNARVKAPDGTWRGLHSVALRQHIRGHKRPRPPGPGHRQAAARRPGLPGLFPGGRRRGGPGPGGGGAHVQTGRPGGGGPGAGRGGLAGGPPGPGALQAGGPRLAPPGLGGDPPAQAEAERRPGRAVRAGTGWNWPRPASTSPPGATGAELVVVAPSVAQVDRDGVAGEVVAGLSAARSAWSAAELTTATERALVRSGVVGDPQAVAELAEDLRARAEARCTSVLVGDEKVPSVMSRHLTSAGRHRRRHGPQPGPGRPGR